VQDVKYVVELGPCFDLGSVTLILKNPENGCMVSDGFGGKRSDALVLNSFWSSKLLSLWCHMLVDNV
jgi:hypothetical protein